MKIRLPRPLGIATIMGKELRSRMHGWRAAVVLTMYLAVLGVIGVAFLGLQANQLQYGGSQMATVGIQIFTLLAFFQLGLLIFISPALTSGAIAGERERQTMDLLLCTRLSAFAIVVGKLVASLSYALLLLLASLPLFSLAFLFGGVSPRQLALVFLVCLATALTIGALGLFVSSLVRRGQVAAVLSYLAAFALTLGTGLAALLIAAATRGNAGQLPWIGYFNPLVALASALFSPAPGSSGGMPFLLAGPTPQRPVWQYTLLLDAALIAVSLLGSMVAVRPQLLRRLRSRRGG